MRPLYDLPDRYEAEHGDHHEDLAFYAASFPEGGVVVEVGAGTGRLLPLSARASRWWAVERSAAMMVRLVQAAARFPVVAPVWADATGWSPPALVDAWLLPFNVTAHLGEVGRAAFWTRAAAASRPGGRLSLDTYVWTPALADIGGRDPGPPGALAQETVVDAARATIRTVTTWADGEVTEVTFVLPTLAALHAELAAAGWAVTEISSEPDGGGDRGGAAVTGPKCFVRARRR